MKLIVNGTTKETKEGLSLSALLEELRLNPDITIVELNRSVVEKRTYASITLYDGDRLELVRIVGGG